MSFKTILLNLLYPPKCPFCGRVLNPGEEGLCSSCQKSLPWVDKPAKTVDFCDGCLSPLWYRDGVRRAVHCYKFRGGRAHSRFFGLVMAQALQDQWEEPVDAIVWVPLFAAALSRRAPEKKTLLSAVFCLAGVGLLTLSSALGFGAGEAWCLAAALPYASAILTTDRLTHGKIDALAAGIVQVGTIGLLGLVSTFLFESPRLPQGGAEWLGILALAVVCTVFGFTLQPVAQRGTTAERAGLFCAVNPMVAAALGAVFLQETLSLQSLAGMGLILLGILVTGVRLPAPSRRKALATAPALGYNEEKTGNCR